MEKVTNTNIKNQSCRKDHRCSNTAKAKWWWMSGKGTVIGAVVLDRRHHHGKRHRVSPALCPSCTSKGRCIITPVYRHGHQGKRRCSLYDYAGKVMNPATTRINGAPLSCFDSSLGAGFNFTQTAGKKYYRWAAFQRMPPGCGLAKRGRAFYNT